MNFCRVCGCWWVGSLESTSYGLVSRVDLPSSVKYVAMSPDLWFRLAYLLAFPNLTKIDMDAGCLCWVSNFVMEMSQWWVTCRISVECVCYVLFVARLAPSK